MRAFCAICSDLFDDFFPLVAAPCGHTFHASCLTQWMDRSKTCPECRKQVTNRNVLKLFFSISTDEQVNSNSLENEIQSLKALVSAKDKDIDTCKREKEEIRFYVSKAENDVESLRQKNYKLEAEIAALNLKVKSLSKLEPKVQRLEQRNLALSRDLEHMNNVQMIVSGTQSDVEDILSGCGNGPEATKQMATYCSMLKRELQQVIDSKHKLRGEITSLKKDVGFNACELKRTREENKVLKEQMSNLEKENTALLKRPLVQSCSNNTPKTAISYESPTPERHKLKPRDIEFKITPISKLPDPKKLKIDINIVHDKGFSSIKTQCASSLASSCQNKQIKFLASSQNEENSVIRNGYNGFGGHSNFIVRSSPIMKNDKKKLSKLKKN